MPFDFTFWDLALVIVISSELTDVAHLHAPWWKAIILLLKASLQGFTTTFPMVTVVGASEACYSLWTLGRRSPRHDNGADDDRRPPDP